MDALRNASPRGKGAILAAVALLFVLFLLAEGASFHDVGPPRAHPDTNAYKINSGLPLRSSGFFLGTKPVVTLGLYKATGRDVEKIARIQSLVSVLCWFCLALAVASELKEPAAKLVAALAICLFSLSLPVNQWDYVLLSESLSLSLLALTLALTILLSRSLADQTRPRVLLSLSWAIACLLLALARDSNIYILAPLWASYALWLVIDGWRSARLHHGLLLALLLLAPIIVGAQLSMRASERWSVPLTNVLLQRVLPDPEIHAEWVARYGLPRNPTFEAYAGKKAWDRLEGGPPLRARFRNRHPEVEDVRVWMTERGMSSYARYLIWDHPVASFAKSFQALSLGVNSRFSEQLFGKGAGRQPWTEELTRWTHETIPHPVWAWGALLVAGAGFGVLLSSRRVLGLAIVFLALTSWAQAFIAYHADTSNIDRHMVSCGVLFRIAVVVFVALSLDELLAYGRGRGRGRSEEEIEEIQGEAEREPG